LRRFNCTVCDRSVERIAIDELRALPLPAAGPLLNPRIEAGYVDSLRSLRERDDVEVLQHSADAPAELPGPTLLATTIDAVRRSSPTPTRSETSTSAARSCPC
jgi:hypothetical protein